MDEKKKFEIEFDDDFDSWLARHEQATKDLKPPAPPVQLASDTPAQQPVQPMFVPSFQHVTDIPAQSVNVPTMQPAADIPVQQKPSAAAKPESVPAKPEIGQEKPASESSGVASSVEPTQPKPDSQQFKPVDSNGVPDILVKRCDVVKNFKVEINEEDYNLSLIHI